MKIKEAAAATSLTEKAIRFYESKGLIKPHTTEYNGKLFRDYGPDDIRRMKTIGALRRAYFTVEQISEIIEYPTRLAEIFGNYRAELNDNYGKLAALLNVVNVINENALSSADSLADALSGVSNDMELPKRDANYTPRFSRFDDGTKDDERREAYRIFLKHQQRRDFWEDIADSFNKNFGWICKIGLPLLALILCMNTFCYTRTVDVTYSGIEWSEYDPDYSRPVTLRFIGTYSGYLFRPDFIEGNLSISGYESRSISGRYYDYASENQPCTINFPNSDHLYQGYIPKGTLDIHRQRKRAFVTNLLTDRKLRSIIFYISIDGKWKEGELGAYIITAPAVNRAEAVKLTNERQYITFGKDGTVYE